MGLTPAEVVQLVAELSGLEREALESYRIPPSRNLFVSDRATVFAKYTDWEGWDEHHGATLAYSLGLPTPRILREPLAVPGGALLLFEWLEVGEGVSPPSAFAELLWRPLEGAVKPRGELAFRKLAGIEGNLALAASSEQKTYCGAKAGELYTEVMLHEAGRPAVLLHGDFHGRNAVTTPGGSPLLLDWEWWGVGVPEADLGKWLQVASVELELSRDFISETVEWALEWGMSEPLLDAYLRFGCMGGLAYHLRYFPESPWREPLVKLSKGGLEALKER